MENVFKEHEKFFTEIGKQIAVSMMFAQMTYDVVEDVKLQIKEFNERTLENLKLENKIHRAFKKMTEHAKLMGHFALSFTEEVQKQFNDLEDNPDIDRLPISFFIEKVDLYECFIMLLVAVLEGYKNDTDKHKELWRLLYKEIKGKVEEIPEPQWEKFKELYEKQ